MATRACARSRTTSRTRWAGLATTGAVEPWVFQQLTQTYMLDPAMRERMAALNPAASARFGVAPDRSTTTELLDARRSDIPARCNRLEEELEDRLGRSRYGDGST